MRRVLPSILVLVTWACASWVQRGSAEVTVVHLRPAPFRAALKARDKKAVDFYKEFFQAEVPVGVVIGTRSEVPIEITEVLVKPPDAGLIATATRSQLTFQTNSRVARTFTVTVSYAVQVQVLQSVYRRGIGVAQLFWVKEGGPQPRTLDILVGVCLPPFDPVVVEEGKEVRVPLPRPATQPQPAARFSGLANVTVDGDDLVIHGKKSGALSWDIGYLVEGFQFKAPLDIEVVRSREAFAEDLEVNGDAVVLPSSRRPKHKFVRLIAEGDREVCGAEKDPKGLRLTGLKEGRTRVTAIALDPSGNRVLADISVRVKGGTGPAREGHPEPGPHAPEPVPPARKPDPGPSRPDSPAPGPDPYAPKPPPADPPPPPPRTEARSAAGLFAEALARQLPPEDRGKRGEGRDVRRAPREAPGRARRLPLSHGQGHAGDPVLEMG